MKTRLVRISNLSIAVHDSESKGKPIILCHGNSCSSKCFQLQFSGNLIKNFRLIAIDWPGHGESSRAADPYSTYTLPGYSRVLLEVVQQLGVSDGVFVGWSLGGHVILEAAEELSQAAGFAIFGTPPLAFPPAMDRAFFPLPSVAVAFRAESTDDEIRAHLNTFFRPGTQVPPWVYEDFCRTDKKVRDSLAASIVPNGYKDEVELVKRLSKPFAIMHGAREQLVNRAYLDELTIPNIWRGAIQLIANAGHCPQWETAPAFDAIIEAFVRDCAG